MAKGPGLYTDIGKKLKDVLYGDYHSDQKFTLSSFSKNTVAITITGTKEGDRVATSVNLTVKPNNITDTLKVVANSKLFTSITITDEPIPGLKAIFSYTAPSAKVELQYLNDYAGINTSLDLTANPIVNFAGAIGTDTAGLGTDVSFDTATRNFTKYDLGFTIANRDLIASMFLNDKLENLSASCYIRQSTCTAIGLECSHRFPTNETTVTVGFQHALDPLTMLKARVTNLEKAGAVLQHEWRPNFLFTLFGEFDCNRAVDKWAKIGISIALKPQVN